MNTMAKNDKLIQKLIAKSLFTAWETLWNLMQMCLDWKLCWFPIVYTVVLIFNWLFCFCVSSFYMLGPSQISEYPEATVVMYVWPLYPTGQTQPLTFNLPCDLPLMDYCSCSSELWNINCTEESRQDSTILTLRAIWYAITLKSHFHLETLLEISVFTKLFTTND